MRKKTLLILGGFIIAIIAGVALFQKDAGQPDDVVDDTGNSAGLIVDKNAIYATEQLPSQTVSVALVRLANPGFVVIHEDSEDMPGQILGQSVVLKAGETKNLSPITLSRSTKDGETLYIMLHFDDGDGLFNPTKDKPVLDSVSGEPLLTIVIVSKDASEPGIINP